MTPIHAILTDMRGDETPYETGDMYAFMIRCLREDSLSVEGLRAECESAIRYHEGMQERPIFSGRKA
jgi:hypothetical protein